MPECLYLFKNAIRGGIVSVGWHFFYVKERFFQKNEIKCFLFRIKSVTLQTEKGVLCNFGTRLKRKILKNNIIIKN